MACWPAFYPLACPLADAGPNGCWRGAWQEGAQARVARESSVFARLYLLSPLPVPLWRRYVWASVALYLDIINLFLNILRLLNDRSN